MKNTVDQYKEKLISPDEAVRVVKYGDYVYYSGFALFPEVLDEAFSRRIGVLKNIDLRSGGFFRVPKIVESDPYREHVLMHDWQGGAVSRCLSESGRCADIPLCCHQGACAIGQYRHFDVAFLTTSAMDKNGYFNYGLSNALTGAVLDKSKRIILEVNESVPYCYGGMGESIHISRVDYVVEGHDTPLSEIQPATPTEAERRIACHIFKELEDGACLRLGPDGLSNRLAEMIVQSDLKDLGIHTDILTDACVDLYRAGKITGAGKASDPFKMTYTVAAGTRKLYDFIDHNCACASYPADYIHDPKIIAQNNKVVAIDRASEIDLFGQVCAKGEESELYAAAAGWPDFLSGALMSRGGKGIISLNSAYRDKEGTWRSSIVPTLAPGSIVTAPASMVQYVTTEYGIVQLAGKSSWERADALIGIAHPDFREELIRQAQRMNLWIKGHRH